GAGVTNARTAAIGASSSGNPSGRAPHAPSAARGSSSQGTRSGGATEAAKALPPAKLLNSGHGGASGVAWMIGVAAIVLAAGGVGGVAIARRNRGTGPPAG